MRELILDVQRELDLTTVVVTHDQEEAVVLAEDIALLFEGRLHQHGAPRTFFEHPATERTARFFGAANLVAGRRHGDRVHSALGTLRVPDGAPGGDEVWLTIRPERLVVGGAPSSDGQHVQGRVVSSAFLGTRTRATVEVAGMRLTVDVADDALADVGPGTLLTLGLPAEALWTVPRGPMAGCTSPAAEGPVHVAAGADGTISSPLDPRARP
jgi:ABC-type Fe3+/spermidine/putrescine transport system ATPase subunit